MIILKMKKIGLLTTMLLISCTALFAQSENNDIRQGNQYFKEGKFAQAEVSYRKALQKNKTSFEANFNLGNALYRQGKYSNAFEQYKNAIALDQKDKKKLAAAFHNLGNALLKDNKLEESIAAYKKALKANPNDNDTRYNLAYAQQLLKKQKDKDKNKDQNKDKKDQQQKQQPQPQQPKMSKDNAQQILDALMQDEKNTLDKTKKQPVHGQKNADKDW